MKAATRWAGLALVLASLASGCARSVEHRPSLTEKACPESTESKPVDAALLAWLSKARSSHHVADLVEEQKGALGEATSPLEKLVQGAVPPGLHPEVEEVLADTFARLADLYASGGDFVRAENAVDAGLRHAPGKTYFRGHLLEVHGLILQRQSRALEAAGEHAKAKALQKEAVTASFEAVMLQDEVIRAALSDAGTEGTRD